MIWQISNITRHLLSWESNYSLDISPDLDFYHGMEDEDYYSQTYDLFDELGYANAKSIGEVGIARFCSDL